MFRWDEDKVEQMVLIILVAIICFIVATYMKSCRVEELRMGERGTEISGNSISLEGDIVTMADSPVRTASWYSVESCQKEGSGGWTASGEKFFDEGLTCAMRSRDFGRYYKITNLANGKFVICRHNDFGPAKRLHDQGRIVDLSRGAFRRIADLREGVIKVRIEEARRLT